MKTARAMLISVIAAAVLGASACGSDAGSGDGIEYPTGADDAVVRFGSASLDESLPVLVIGGDGWAYVSQPEVDGASGIVAGVAPAPPEAQPVVRRRLTEAGMQIVLGRADELGLLDRPPVYEDPQITDVGSTVVELTTTDDSYVHEAIGLGIPDPESGDRKRLSDFAEDAADLEQLVGTDNLGPAEPYVPDEHLVVVRSSFLDSDETSERRWPAAGPVEEGCAELPLDAFDEPPSGSYVVELDGELQRVSVIPAVPGGRC